MVLLFAEIFSLLSKSSLRIEKLHRLDEIFESKCKNLGKLDLNQKSCQIEKPLRLDKIFRNLQIEICNTESGGAISQSSAAFVLAFR